MSDERYIAAIEISSSKIIGAVGRIYGDGQLDIIAVEQEKNVEVVRYGIIQNLEEASLRLARIIEKLERKATVAPRKIDSVFVGLSGRSLRSIPTVVRRHLPEDTEITDDIIGQLRGDALNSAIDSSLEVVDAVPRYYKVGKRETHSPKGSVGNEIEAYYDIIVCRPELKRNIQRTVCDKLGINVEGYVVTALAASHLILSGEEKRLGCMLADIGAETTTVTIYSKGALNYFATLPFGGRNVTRDITSLSLLEERAEELKIQSGNAIPLEQPSSLNINGVKLSDVANLVVARSEEIAANIAEQIAYAEFKEKNLPGGIVCIGGGAKLNGMTELLSRQTGLPTRMGRLPAYVRIDDSKAMGSEIIEVASVLYAGGTLTDAECLCIPEQEELPVTGTAEDFPEESVKERGKVGKEDNGPSFSSKIYNKLAKLFSGPNDDDSDIL